MTLSQWEKIHTAYLCMYQSYAQAKCAGRDDPCMQKVAQSQCALTKKLFEKQPLQNRSCPSLCG